MNEEDKKAVALEYKHGIDPTPRVLAQGSGSMAEEMIAIAKAHGIALHEDKDMLEMLSTLDLNESIPPELYRAVAEVLVFVYATSGRF